MEGRKPLLWSSKKFGNIVICSRTENRKSKMYLMNEMSRGAIEGAAWLPTMNREGKTEPQRVLGIHPREVKTVHTKCCPQVFRAALFTSSPKSGNNPEAHQLVSE